MDKKDETEFSVSSHRNEGSGPCISEIINYLFVSRMSVAEADELTVIVEFQVEFV